MTNSPDAQKPASSRKADKPELIMQGVHISSEEMQDKVAREKRLREVLERQTPLTKILVGVNVVLWIFAFFWGDTLDIRTPYFNNPQLVFYTGMKINARILDGEWWRLISSQFVHLNFMHIAFNAYGLYVLGPMVERFYGWRRFLVLYLASGTAGALASFYFVEANSGGASGAIYGLVGALLVFGFKYRQELPERVSRALTYGMMPWVVFSLGIGFLDGIPMDNAAHLGGLAAGGLMVLMLTSHLRPAKKTPIGEQVVWALAIAAIAVLVWTGVEWVGESLQCVSQGKAAYFACYPELQSLIR